MSEELKIKQYHDNRKELAVSYGQLLRGKRVTKEQASRLVNLVTNKHEHTEGFMLTAEDVQAILNHLV